MPVWSPALFFSSTSEEAYVIQDSVMFDGTADYLTLTFNEAGDTAKWTASVWIKRGDISTGIILEARADGNNTGALYFNVSDIFWQDYDDGVGTPAWRLNSDNVYRDPTAWMHLVVINDTADSTSGDRQRIYVNGTRLTSFSTATYSSQGYASAQGINSTNPHYIGFSGSGDHFGGYMSEFIFLDGIAPSDASPFGETNDDGVWIPKDPSDTDNIADWGGSNSFWLKFADATNLGFNSRPTALTANAGTYKIDNSLWLDGSADYLYRTPSSGSASTKYTLSIWFKRGTFSEQYLFMQGSDASNLDVIEFTSDHRLQIRWYPNTVAADLITTQVFRDPSAWQHLVISVDTTLGVAGNRIKIYVNGVRVTAFDTQSNPSSSATSMIGGTSQMTIGRKTPGTTWYYPGYLAEYIFLDGYAGTATDFGGWDANGDWLPVDPTTVVTNNKGTNGFHLDFALAQGDGNGPGNDISGNNNDFTNVSLTAAQTTTDTPTNTSADNEGNYITFSPIDKNSNITLAGGNLTVTNTGAASFQGAIATQRIPNSGKHYFEVTLPGTLSNQYIGVVNEANKWDFVTAADGSTSAGFYGFYPTTGTSSKVDNGSSSSYGGAIGNGSVLGFAIDKDNNEMYVSDDGTFLASSNPVTRASPMLSSLPDDLYVSQTSHNSGGHSLIFNFGQTAFAGSIPSGYVRLNTSELATPTVTDPRKYWSNTLYVGSAAIRSVRQCFDSTGTAWTPDFVWIKNRTGTVASHHLYDVVRGVNKFIKPNNTDAQDSSRTDMLTSFDSGGFSLGVDASEEAINKNNDTYVAWCMKAGGAASSNSNGSITTSVSAADHGGFSIATWTGNGSAGATIGHGLSRKPAMGIFRRLSLAQDWAVYHEALDASAPEDKYLNLNLNDAAGDATWLNDTPPSASIWTLGTSGYVNTSSETFVAYSFARTPGLIGIGSYIANADADGPNIIIDDGASGFRPAFILVKNADASSRYWVMLDSARNTFNPVQNALIASETLTEATGYFVDFTANGFKIRVGGGTQLNTGSDKHIYLAFADEPFNLARAR